MTRDCDGYWQATQTSGPWGVDFEHETDAIGDGDDLIRRLPVDDAVVGATDPSAR